MSSAKAVVALIVSVFIAAATVATTTVHDHTWLVVLTIALAGVNPLAVWAASNTKASTPPVVPPESPQVNRLP